MGLHRYFYRIGERLKNPYLRKHFKALMDTDKAPLETLKAIQLQRLKKLLHHARSHSEFYKTRLKDLDIENMTLEDLSKIPLLTKKELHENNHNLRNKPKGESLIPAETSGTTGQAFSFYKNIQWDASFRAAQYRGYTWYNVHPCEKSLFFWGFRKKIKNRLKTRFLDFLLNRYRFFDYTNEEFERAAERVKISSYIAGYSSSIHMMAQYFLKKGYTFNNIKLVKGTAEKVHDSYHETILEVFGCRMTSEYGSAEAGVIAFECPEGNMHIVMENVIVEEIDNKIIITNLWSYSHPIIRFELGDYVILDEKTKCDCGREHSIIKEVTGRIGQQIHGKKKLYSAININHTFKYFSSKYKIDLSYAAKQHEKGVLVFEIIDDKELNHIDIRKKLITSAEAYFGDDVTIVVKFLSYSEGKQKKQKDFESFIKEGKA